MTRNRLRKLTSDERGFSLVFVGLGCMAFVAASMLAIDVGMLMTARSQAQNSADAGALAGATALAFDNWDDRTPTGPAVVNAIAAAKANNVMGAQVAVAPADVVFLSDPVDGTPDRVQVTVRRTAATGNPVSTLIAQYFGIATADISAVATAEASPANAMTCVKPFTIPDKWREVNSPPWMADSSFDRYDKKGNLLANPDVYVPAFDASGGANAGYTGYNTEANRGTRLVLRAGSGNEIQPSFYFSLAMLDSMGGDDYRWNIANCNHSIYHWGDMLTQEPGDKQGPTIDGITDLIARDPGAVWDDSTNTVKNSSFGDRQSPRIFPIPLFDPDYYDYGKQTGRVASLKTANWIGFFAEYVGSGSEIHGRIIPIAGIRDKTWTGGVSSFPRTIRLVQ
ncbi:MAG TPA: pilus assembly protein TadG-related protein [Vicinamibacterales bacterium]|nr:pilus assembly protein TadG-related protein [Vicinamibacterales bacterium]